MLTRAGREAIKFIERATASEHKLDARVKKEEKGGNR